ncbi:LEF-12 [Chrysodeixis includens nucleopolyhedrovirus]|uniref:LEF-12 n=1 Tax=Chrysodeixis includens nucleopolyhedrovirus TaxID=1207438 RepID=A0A5B8YTJ5_9ABAC|nr:LEF-12 [Chrysodeixis includens nucleopolyhedrovirus]QED40558.1 LEF-12 [Chrysodeixis includens nucleopolyhedrovirus]
MIVRQRLPKIEIINTEAFNDRVAHVWDYVVYMKSVVAQLESKQVIGRDDAYSLCLADDTAAWICGRVPTANYVTFRMFLYRFSSVDGSMHASTLSRFLRKKGFEESFEQQLQILFPQKKCCGRYFMFTKFDGKVAINLIVSHFGDRIEHTNPCPQLSYFIHVNRIDVPDKEETMYNKLLSVTTRDCNCLRTVDKQIDLLFDKHFNVFDQFYYRHMFRMWDLIESNHDDGIVSIDCKCTNRPVDDNINYNSSHLKEYAKTKHLCELCFMFRNNICT